MKKLFTLLLFAISVTAFAQEQKSDTTKAMPADTIKIDLRTYGTYDKLMQIEFERRDIQNEAKILQARLTALDVRWNDALTSEVAHEPKLKGREALPNAAKVVGMELIVPVKKKEEVKKETGKKPK
jgi:hypothetical protein